MSSPCLSAHLLGGLSVVHDIEADGTHEFTVERARRHSYGGAVRHHFMRFPMQLIQAKFCKEIK